MAQEMSPEINERRNQHAIELSAENLSVCYDSRSSNAPQLNDVTIRILAGQLTAVIGPNGSGKTALVRTLSRTLAPKSGAVKLNSLNLYTQVSANESALAIAVVPQMTELFLDFTVRDIVAMGRAPHRSLRGALAADSSIDEEAVNAALTSLTISDELACRSISKVSGGERQRALVARALAQEASILLLDEPTASLDLKATHSILRTARGLAHERGKAVMIVLHDLNAAAEYADRIAVLSEGRLVALGTPGEVLSAELIEQVYEVKVQVGKNPVTGRPNVVVVE